MREAVPTHQNRWEGQHRSDSRSLEPALIEAGCAALGCDVWWCYGQKPNEFRIVHNGIVINLGLEMAQVDLGEINPVLVNSLVAFWFEQVFVPLAQRFHAEDAEVG